MPSNIYVYGDDYMFKNICKKVFAILNTTNIVSRRNVKTVLHRIERNIYIALATNYLIRSQL